MCSISTRGINSSTVDGRKPADAMTDDPVAISELADSAMEAADEAGIATTEITDEVPSVFDVIAEAMDHREGGTP